MNKYIDADKLIAEIERRMEDCKLPDGRFPTTTNIVRYEELSCLRNFITSLQKEQPTKGYDEAYLNECIAKARKAWKGVDVDKYMDEMRGREQEQPDAKLDDSIVNEWAGHFSPEIRDSIKSTAYHFWDMALEGLR